MPFTSFSELDPNAPVFRALYGGHYPWWDNLKSNKDISVQIRKDNAIDAYFNGGAVLMGLKYSASEQRFTARVHRKYIPLKDETAYQPLSLTEEGVLFSGEVKPMAFEQLGTKQLTAITSRIKTYHGSGSEKLIQYKIATTDPYIIDTEFQCGEDNLRIDLVRLDVSVRRLVFIEIKTTDDPRLFPGKTNHEDINDQLEKYYNFVRGNATALLEYYAKVLQIKRHLGLVPDLNELSLNGWQVEEKPLLAFGDCTQRWIDNNAADINSRIQSVARGVYYYGGTAKEYGDGSYSLDLKPAHKGKNQYIF